ncbi:MAG: ABC transporter permease, partial [Sphingobacteriales bacterium]
LVQELFLQKDRYSSVEISVRPGSDVEKIRSKLEDITGSSFKVATRYEQNRTMYMVMQTEKWAVYAILLLVLLIASFNMVGALTLLVLEKQKDIAILKAMGAPGRSIRAVFITEGLLWSLAGGFAGLAIGIGLCLGQQHYNWIRLQGTFIIDSYPVAVRYPDIAVVIITVIIVGMLAAIYPSFRATRVEDPSLKST